MAKLKRYPNLTKESLVNPHKVVLVVFTILFVAGFLYGAKQIITVLRDISAGQQILIEKIAGADTQNIESVNSGPDSTSGDVVSKIEFVKFRNETRKTIRDLTKDLRRVQAKLRMRQTVLDKY